MAELSTIARPYAEAAFKTAHEMNALPAWSDALSRLAQVVVQPDAQALIGNPKLSDAQVAALVCDTAGQLSNEQRNFVKLMAQNERLSVMPQVAEQFAQLRRDAEGELRAEVASAYPLSDTQIGDIATTLAQKYGKKVQVSVSVDPELIGGVSIRIGDEVMDASVRGKLARLAAQMAG
jgi:F-type H+-transporting ATPase subunit delta